MKRTNNNPTKFVQPIQETFRRAIVIGAPSNTYYASKEALEDEFVQIVDAALADNGAKAVETIRQVLVAGIAPKLVYPIFALAKATLSTSAVAKQLAYDTALETLNTWSNVLLFTKFRSDMGAGWGRAARSFYTKWLASQTPERLAFQFVKYQNRAGWNARDVLRLTHIPGKMFDHEKQDIISWAVNGWSEELFAEACKRTQLPKSIFTIFAHEASARATTDDKIIELVKAGSLTWEGIPTQWLNSKDVWKALLPNIGFNAVIRNINRLSELGFGPKDLASKFTEEGVVRSRMHPFNILTALKVYSQGHGVKGDKSWAVNQEIIKLLEWSLEAAFANVPEEPFTILDIVDDSGSMGGWNSWGSGWGSDDKQQQVQVIQPFEAAALFAWQAAKKAKLSTVMMTSSNVDWVGDLKGLKTFGEVCQRMKPYQGSTNLGAGMVYAVNKGMRFDAIRLFTDGQGNMGGGIQSAIDDYRKKMNPFCRMQAHIFTYSNIVSELDPTDPFSVTVAGLDASSLSITRNFVMDLS